MHGDIFSGEWWITVGVGAVVLGLITRYLGATLDRVAIRMLSSWQTRSAAAKAKQAARLEALRAHPEWRQEFANSEFRKHFGALALLVFAVQFLVMFVAVATIYQSRPDIPMPVLGEVTAIGFAISMFLAMRLESQAFAIRRLLFEAKPADSWPDVNR